MKTSTFAPVVLLAAATAAWPTVHTQDSQPSTIGTAANRRSAAPTEPAKSGQVAINGINYYYEIHGRGEPLLLLHGGLLSIDLMRPIIPALAKHRQVIGVDLQGHGRTGLGSRPISLVDSGNDLSVLLQRLGHRQVDVLGYSFGGGAGLRLAIQHPAQVRRLVVVSAPYAQDGFFPEMLPQQAAVSGAIADTMKETPIYKSYARVAPRPQEFPRLLDRMGEYMRKPYDWSADVKMLKVPVLLIYGDSDMIRPEHMVSFYQLLGGGLKDAGWQREHMAQNRLAILPNLTHYETGLAPEMTRTALTFLERDDGTASASVDRN
jgi:pimeloyl-ACP methyl ester carboxylesterase